MALFQLRFGNAVARGRAGSGCAWAEYNRTGKLRTLDGTAEVTPHPPSYLGHPLPKGEGCNFDFSPASPGVRYRTGPENVETRGHD
jgi:hypothetical protein